MNYVVYINGKLVSAEEARISVFDAAYLYGEGLFETLAAIHGKVLFFDKHIKRLYSSAKKLKIPAPLSTKKLKSEVYRTLKANNLTNAYIRIGLSAEEEDVGARIRSLKDVNLVIFTKPVDPYPPHLYTKGARLILIRSVQNDSRNIAGLKSTNYLSKVIARREIAKRGADEGILLNAEGRITECAGSNLFIVKKGKLMTPPLKEGLLPGITRQVLLDLARKKKILCIEKPLTVKDLKTADEIFITSTLKGVLPVRKFEQSLKQVPGRVTQSLYYAYESNLSRMS
jgi:branched-chain amino acid aminotransferase